MSHCLITWAVCQTSQHLRNHNLSELLTSPSFTNNRFYFHVSVSKRDKLDKGPGTLLGMLYKENTKVWDSCNWLLTFLILTGSKITFTWKKKLHLKSLLKGSGAPQYPIISPDFTLKSIIFQWLTENLIELSQILMKVEIFSCKNYFQWAIGIMCILHLKHLHIDLHRESGSSGRLWITHEVFYSEKFNISV